MKEGESSFLDRRISRRGLMKAGVGIAVGLAVADAGNISLTDTLRGWEIAREYGPDVARAVIEHPGQSLEAYKLWKRPEKSYLKSPAFSESLIYRRGVPNNIIAFGDSNMVGPQGTDWHHSPIILFNELAKNKGIEDWKDFDCAKSGYTTNRVREEQVHSPRAEAGFRSPGKSDVWINVGGNDVSHLVENENEIQELKQLADDPFSDMKILFKYTDRIEENINSFGQRFKDLLEAINASFAEEILHYVILSMPDFGRANSIRTQEINGVEYVVDIRSSAARRLIENIAVRMNNKMFDAVDIFSEQTKQRVIGINTAVPAISQFSENQHFSFGADKAIAEAAFDRVRFINGA